MTSSRSYVSDSVLKNAKSIDIRHNLNAEREHLSASERKFLSVLFEDIDKAVHPVPVVMRKDSFSENYYKRDLYLATVATSLNYDIYQDHLIPEAYRKNRPKTKTLPFSHFKLRKFDDHATLFELSSNFNLTRFKSFHSNAVLTSSRLLMQLANDDANNAAKYHNTYKSAFMVVLPEFAFPFPMNAAEHRDYLTSLFQNLEPGNKDKWEALYLISGTFHDHYGFRNLAVLDWPFVPDLHDSHAEVSQFEPDFGEELQTSYKLDRTQTYHPKQIAAEKLGEKLKPRDGIRWTYYDTPIGLICTLICYDAFDARMLLRLVRWRLDRPDSKQIACIVVPTFSGNDKIREKCQLISEWLQCMVVYVNTQYRTYSKDKKSLLIRKPHPGCHGLFVCGQDLTSSCDSIDEIIKHRKKKRYDFDLDHDLWFEVNSWQINLDGVIKYTSACGQNSDFLRGMFPETPGRQK